MTIETRARSAANAVRTQRISAANFDYFLRHAAAARRRRRAYIGSLAVALLLGLVLPLAVVTENYRKISPARPGIRKTETTPTPAHDQKRPQGIGSSARVAPRPTNVAAQAGTAQTEERTVSRGGRIFYSSSDEGAATGLEAATDSIWVMNADGSGRKRLAEGYKPDPSPDGRRIVYVRLDKACAASNPDKEQCQQIWVMNADGTDQQLLTKGDAPDWSPDAARIAFTRWAPENDDNLGTVHIMDADGSGVRKLARGDTTAGDRPRWSPDGRWIAFTKAETPEYDCTGINITEVDGPGGSHITPPGCFVGSPSWSPDGEQIAFYSSRGSNTLDLGIYVVNRDDTGLRRLTARWDGDEPHAAGSPSWSEDGKRITYAFDADGDQRLRGPGWLYCRRTGGPLDTGDDCRAAGPTPSDVYVMDADGSGAARLAQGNHPAFSS